MSIVTNINSTAMDEKVDWCNQDNNAFYETVKSEGLKKIAEEAGLTTGCDLKILRPYWTKAQSIFEAGAGYGRVVNYLIKHNFQGSITAIERCNSLFKDLMKQFSIYKNISLLNHDLNYYHSYNQKYDLALVLWYSIADFSKIEQPLIFRKLKSLLSENGYLIIDTLPENTLPIASTDYGKQDYLIKADHIAINTSIRVHLLNSDDIKQLAYKAGFSNIKLIPYKTDNQRERWLYVLN